MRALLALPLLLAFVPTAAADADADPPVQPALDPVRCLLGPHIPETPLYYIVFFCTAGQLGVPEPIYYLTGCRLGFPATNIQCPFWDGQA